MDSFSEYMNRITAEKGLKDNTKAFVKAALANRTQQNTNANSGTLFVKEKSTMKKLFFAVSSVAACAILGVSGYAYYNMPVNYISLDINPSVELGINAFNTIVSTEGYNDDGNLLLKEKKLTNLSLEKAIGELVQEAAKKGFIADDGSTVIAVTAESNNEKTAAKLQSTSSEGVNLALATKNLAAIVYADCSSLELRTKAKEMGISPGKYKLIEILQTLEPGITADQYKNAKITDIMTKANSLITSGATGKNQSEEFDKALKMMISAAQKVQATKGNAEKEKNINGAQNQNQSSESGKQEQKQNSSSVSQAQKQSQSKASSSPAQEKNTNQNQSSSGVEKEQEQNKVQAAGTISETGNTAQGNSSSGQNSASSSVGEQSSASNGNAAAGGSQSESGSSTSDNTQNGSSAKGK